MSTGNIANPILAGFQPDASILRVGDDYYIATSTFEWFPGVVIHHSKDLVHWRTLTRALDRVSQLDLLGAPSSGGIWAPALSYDNGTFYLCITDVKARRGVYKDLHNYIVSAPSITGPWSDPVYLNSSGFDHFLFHDTDGRKWLFNMQWDFRKNKKRFAGIVMQEYSVAERKLIGPVHKVTEGTDLGVTEGPMVYKRGGYYYLLLAEGGTGINHAATLMRSRSITGPYEVDPDYPVLTTAGHPEYPLQKAGHGSLVETQNGEWYMVHICSRQLPDGSGLSPLGRETAIQKVVWTEDGWLRLAAGGRLPQLEAPAPDLPPYPFPAEPARDEFGTAELGVHWHTLRVPADDSWLSLTARPGYLRLTGRESLNSWHRQSLVARRIGSFRCSVETCVEFEPECYTQMAGLVLYYDEQDHFYLRISHDETYGKHLAVVTSERGQYDEAEDYVSVEGWGRCYLRAVIDNENTRFSYSGDGSDWKSIGPALYTGQLADEYQRKLSFTGAMAGVCVQDLRGTALHADFDYFEYREHETL
ncbi:xylan beta-1,4-xylosidase [Paenibacillus mucilaginosus 3016]|uniref:Xylan beta-1,4-xylosidase n=1 Tax=Paenibacillus mucilaginosus 3016 TaxID=1116391 RepID=H6NA54_9BACL|nr:glycoside hydrolase family 43 protein [Paenibacillus mucilaginosus]AFC28898.1 xylan beta-1,4-xylosidase [Paenibacillus mucilaginosus 3016]WFA17653.1 glycoside hydrolase family 43 protein [Paenibacillus mucilaginosus]